MPAPVGCIEESGRGERLMKYVLTSGVLLMLALSGCASYQERAAKMTSYERAEECREYKQMFAKYASELQAQARSYDACIAQPPKLVRKQVVLL